uniref:Si:ch211-282b22.1 n=1 Tax=Angiostrongylus cantonensis TaxID=6313 RepID=A0A0K0DLX7_ANGCA
MASQKRKKKKGKRNNGSKDAVTYKAYTAAGEQPMTAVPKVADQQATAVAPVVAPAVEGLEVGATPTQKKTPHGKSAAKDVNAAVPQGGLQQERQAAQVAAAGMKAVRIHLRSILKRLLLMNVKKYI